MTRRRASKRISALRTGAWRARTSRAGSPAPLCGFSSCSSLTSPFGMCASSRPPSSTAERRECSGPHGLAPRKIRDYAPCTGPPGPRSRTGPIEDSGGIGERRGSPRRPGRLESRASLRRLARQPTATVRRRRLLALLIGALAVGVAIGILLSGGGHELRPGGGQDHDPLAWQPRLSADFEQRAAAGESHVLYAKTPGGARPRRRAWRTGDRSSRRARAATGSIPTRSRRSSCSRARAAPTRAADARPERRRRADPDPRRDRPPPARACTSTSPASTRVIGRSLRRARAAGDGALIARLRAQRPRVDERFDPPKALAATARYLAFAEARSAATTSPSSQLPHGHRQPAERAARLRRGRRLLRAAVLRLHAAAPRRRLPPARARSATTPRPTSGACGGARDHAPVSLRPGAAARISGLQTRARTRPRRCCTRATRRPVRDAAQLRAAYADGAHRRAAARAARARPRGSTAGWASSPARLGQPLAALPRAARARALALLAYLGAGVKRICGESPLVVTSTVRDERYQRAAVKSNREATRELLAAHDRLGVRHPAQLPQSRAQALAFEFMLERLQSLDLIAWVREPAAIHVTVSSDARRLEPLLDRVKSAPRPTGARFGTPSATKCSTKPGVYASASRGSSPRSLPSPSRIRLLTVPIGSPSCSAISLWLRPAK